MPKHEGLVIQVINNGKAEVLIKPGTPGIIGAPEVSKKVCHVATDGSTVRTRVLNPVGANKGDWVLVTHNSAVLLKNMGTLLGSPIAGGLLGGLIGFATGGAGLQGIGITIAAAIGIGLGLVIGGTLYKKTSIENLPVISRVIKTREEVKKIIAQQGPLDDRKEDDCNLCTGCFK